MGVFAASAFDPRENVKLNGQTQKISLAGYAARIKFELVSAADLNEKLRGQGVQKEITVQEICKIARDEKEVRDTLSLIWESPQTAKDITTKVITKTEKYTHLKNPRRNSPPPPTTITISK